MPNTKNPNQQQDRARSASPNQQQSNQRQAGQQSDQQQGAGRRGGDHDTRVKAGEKAAKTAKERYGENFHEEIGRKGGENSHGGRGGAEGGNR